MSPEEAEIVRQYLAGSLSDKEARMVETRMVDDPEFRNEVELTKALRYGLRELERRGELAPLLSPRRAIWSQPRVALAASVAAVALGAASFLFFSQQDRAPAGVPTETLQFVQTRSSGGEPDVIWVRPATPPRLELRFDVGLEPAPAYEVRILRMSDGMASVVLESSAQTTQPGEAIVLVDGALLEPGDYQLRLSAPTVGSPSDFTYTLRVTEP
jgi:hypothetical protein